jgi:hypothetical protein
MKCRALLVPFAVVAALLAAACGDSPSSPSGAGSVVVQGVVLGEGASVTASSGSHADAAGGTITVRVEGTPSLKVTVSANGTFKLEGVPAGTFVLIFEKDGVEIGRVSVTAADGAEVKIVVQIQGSSVVVVDLKVDGDDNDAEASRTCPISGGKVHQGIELEGDVVSSIDVSGLFQMTTEGGRSTSPIDVSAASASFKCNGNSKGSTDCKAAVKAGAKVHVRGVLMDCTTGANPKVTASEVMVQKAAD